MTRMVALKQFDYDKRTLSAGEVFETVDDRHDFVMQTQGLCRKAKEPEKEQLVQEAQQAQDETPAKPGAKVGKDRYLRRDLRAKE